MDVNEYAFLYPAAQKTIKWYFPLFHESRMIRNQIRPSHLELKDRFLLWLQSIYFKQHLHKRIWSAYYCGEFHRQRIPRFVWGHAILLTLKIKMSYISLVLALSLYTLRACVHAVSLQSCPTHCNPINCSLPGCSI